MNNLYGDPEIDRLARDFLAAHDGNRHRGVPRRVLGYTARLEKERDSKLEAACALLMLEAMIRIDPDAVWDDGRRTLYRANTCRIGTLRIRRNTSGDEPCPSR